MGRSQAAQAECAAARQPESLSPMNTQVQDHPSVKGVIVGVSGLGKSTLFEKLINRETADWIFLYDHKGGDLARRFGPSCFNLEQLVAATDRGGFVIFDPSKLFPGKPEKGFEFFCNFAWTVGRELKGVKIFGSDELDALIDPRNAPDDFLQMLDQGRTYQFNIYMIAQAMNTLHNLVRKQFTEIFAFRQGDSNGEAWLVGKGFDDAELQRLRPGEWLYANTNTGHRARGGKSFVPKNSGRDLRGL